MSTIYSRGSQTFGEIEPMKRLTIIYGAHGEVYHYLRSPTISTWRSRNKKGHRPPFRRKVRLQRVSKALFISFPSPNFCYKTELFKLRDVRKPSFDCKRIAGEAPRSLSRCPGAPARSTLRTYDLFYKAM